MNINSKLQEDMAVFATTYTGLNVVPGSNIASLLPSQPQVDKLWDFVIVTVFTVGSRILFDFYKQWVGKRKARPRRKKTIPPATLLICLMFGLASCSTSKRTIESTYFKSDSLASQVNRQSDLNRYSSYSIKQKDTVIPFIYKSVGVTLTPEQLQPLYTAQGQPQQRKYILDTNGLRATITAMLDGSIQVKCEADSYKVIVQNLIRINDSFVLAATVRNDSTAVNISKKEITYRELFKKVGGWTWGNKIIIGVVILIIIIIQQAYKFIKNKKLL